MNRLANYLVLLGRLAPRNVIRSQSRTAVAVAALMIAVSVTIGVQVMISSFRTTVTLWLEQTMRGDIYISEQGVSTTASIRRLTRRSLSLHNLIHGRESSVTVRTVTWNQNMVPWSSSPADLKRPMDPRLFLAVQGDP